jgi:hypothetical protein
LQHIDFPLPRKHKPALFIAIEAAPLTTMVASVRSRHRRASRDPSLADRLIKIFGN